jgi:hypothetical protein
MTILFYKEMMKWTFVIAFALNVSSSFACKCRLHSFKEEVASSDQIFIGKVIRRNESDIVYFHFIISEVYKGDMADTITIKTGFGGPDCGMEFVVGKEYLVYANQQRTSRCRRNALALNNPDIQSLRRKSDKNINSGSKT